MATLALPVTNTRRRPRSQPVSGRAGVPEVCFAKKIDNSRLVREVDRDRKRECYSLLITAVLLAVAVMGIERDHLQLVKANYQIEALRSESATLEAFNKQLRLEKAALDDPQRIDALARGQLGLAPPSPQQVIRVGGVPSAAGGVGDSEVARNFRAAPLLPGTGPRAVTREP